MKFFKPEDFADLSTTAAEEDACEIANAKLESDGKIVYSTASNPLMNSWFSAAGTPQGGTYKALLINIESIQKCEHPKEKVKVIKKETYPISSHELDGTFSKYIYQCECGARVEPLIFGGLK